MGEHENLWDGSRRGRTGFGSLEQEIKQFYVFFPEAEMKKIDQLAEEQAKNMNLSAVRLCFQTYLPDEKGHFVRCLAPVYSKEIYDSSMTYSC